MIEAARPRPGDRALEIGTGSGYAAAVLATIVAEVYTERLTGLAEGLRGTLLAGGIAVDLDLRHRGARPADIGRGRVHEKVLAGPVEPGRLGLVGGRQKGVPGESVDGGRPRSGHGS